MMVAFATGEEEGSQAKPQPAQGKGVVRGKKDPKAIEGDSNTMFTIFAQSVLHFEVAEETEEQLREMRILLVRTSVYFSFRSFFTVPSVCRK